MAEETVRSLAHKPHRTDTEERRYRACLKTLQTHGRNAELEPVVVSAQ